MNIENSEIKEWSDAYGETIWIDGIPWDTRNKMLRPIVPPHIISNINRNLVHKSLPSTDAFLAYWTEDWDREESEWWWICCDDKNYDIENINSSLCRRDIRKGLKKTSVSRVEPRDFPDLTYDIYTSALKSYGFNDSVIPSRDQYREEITRRCGYKGYELWGVFVDGKIAGFQTVIVIDNAALYDISKSDPAFHKYNPNNALYYVMTKHYLQERQLLYVSNGPRTLLHSTTINDFLLRMGFRKVYGRLNIELSNLSKMILFSGVNKWKGSLKGIEKIFPQQWSKLQGFSKLIEISKSF